MATLANLCCVPTGLRLEFDAVASLEIEDTPLGGGGFGQNYVCRAMNGAAPPLPLVVKVLIDDGKGSARHGWETIGKLQERLRDLDARCRQRGEPAVSDVTGLLAVPQFSFEARLHGQSVCGYGALRLDTLGYVPFDTFTDGDEDRAREYLSLPLEDRMRIACDLAQGFRLLDEIGFVHGDINPQNLFVNLAEGRLAVIDFDSGAVIENPGDQPGTWGKPGDWLAPEVTAQLAGAIAAIVAGPAKQVLVDRLSDAWSVGIGIHYLLFLHHPLVYLADFGTKTLQDYFAQNLWPQISRQDALYNAANDAVYQRYRQELHALPSPLQNAFDVLLNRGTLAPEERPDGVAWVRALGAAQPPPKIRFFTADRLLVPAGGAVTLSWEVERAHQVWLDGVGDVTGRMSAIVTPRHDTSFTLIAHGAFGQVQETTPLVRVLFGPVIRSLSVPFVPPALLANTPSALSAILVAPMSAPRLSVSAPPRIRIGGPSLRLSSPRPPLPLSQKPVLPRIPLFGGTAARLRLPTLRLRRPI